MRSGDENKEHGGLRVLEFRKLSRVAVSTAEMATQKPGGWVQSLITRFESQVSRVVGRCSGEQAVRPTASRRPHSHKHGVRPSFVNGLPNKHVALGFCATVQRRSAVVIVSGRRPKMTATLFGMSARYLSVWLKAVFNLLFFA